MTQIGRISTDFYITNLRKSATSASSVFNNFLEYLYHLVEISVLRSLGLAVAVAE